jgi:hypothetical protein
VVAEVSGRPKHLYSIYNKMRTKDLSFDEVQDLRAFRVLVADTRDCYTVLGVVHEIWPPIPREFDDYISRPKPNGYQSLHTVVIAEDDRPLEIQIRTRAMHQHAEFGVASHWRYKETSTGVVSGSPQARVEWMRQLLMWQQEVGATLGGKVSTAGEGEGERIYLLTPQAKVIELPAGATPVDFAYHVHSGLGHRCRGARVDGQLVPLNTVLRNGQTVEVVVARAGSGQDGPSRDWLNPQLGFVRSPRARAKVRQWFNALELARDLANGRDKVERVLDERCVCAGYELCGRPLGGAHRTAEFLKAGKVNMAEDQEHQGAQAGHHHPAGRHHAVAGGFAGGFDGAAHHGAAAGQQHHDGNQHRHEKPLPYRPHQHRARLRLHDCQGGRPQRDQHEGHAAHPDNGGGEVKQFDQVVHGGVPEGWLSAHCHIAPARQRLNGAE